MLSKEEILELFGRNVRKYRKEKGVTQLDLSVAAGMDISNLQRIEAAQHATNVVYIYRIAKALDISVNELFE